MKSGYRLYCFLFFLYLLFSVPSNASQKWNFSQQKYLKALEEIARRGNFHILADVPDSLIASFSLPASVSAEDTLHALTQIMNDHTWRLGSTFLVIPKEKFLQREGRPMLILRPEERPAETFWGNFAGKFPVEMRPFIVPEANLLVFSAFPSELEMLREAVQKWDSGRKPIKLSIGLGSGKEPVGTASMTVLMIDGTSVTAQMNFSDSAQTLTATFTGYFSDSGDMNLTADISASPASGASIKVNSPGKRAAQPDSGKFSGSFKSGEYQGTWTAEILPEKFRIVASMPQSPEPNDSTEFFPHSENASPSKFMSLVWAEKPYVEVLRGIVASEGGTNLVCSTSCSGTISVFCFGEELYYEEFMSLIAKTKNLGVRKIGNTWIVAEQNLFSDSYDRGYYITKRLQSSLAKSTCTILKNMFSNFGVSSSDIQVSFDSFINAVLIGGKKNPIESARNVLEVLDRVQPRLTLNVKFSFGKISFRETLQNPVGTLFSREIKTPGGNANLELLPVMFGEKGAIGLRWKVMYSGGKTPFTYGGWTFLSEEEGNDLLAVPGIEPLNLKVFGNVAWVPPPERRWEYPIPVASPTETASGSVSQPDGFDKAFDSSF